MNLFEIQNWTMIDLQLDTQPAGSCVLPYEDVIRNDNVKESPSDTMKNSTGIIWYNLNLSKSVEHRRKLTLVQKNNRLSLDNPANMFSVQLNFES